MPGSLSVKLAAGCDGTEAIMELSSTAEPDGDHYATINWYFYPVTALLTIELETTPGVWVSVPSTFLFSELGETYTLRARGSPDLIGKLAGNTFPYKVYGIYAPDWASVYGEVVIEEDTTSCCTPDGDFYIALTSYGMFSTSYPSQTCFVDFGCSAAQCINDPSWDGLPNPTSVGADINTDWFSALSGYPSPTKTAFYETAISSAFDIPVTHNGGLYSTAGRISGTITKPANSWITTVTPTLHKGIGSGRFSSTAVSGTTYSTPTVIPVGSGGCVAITLKGRVVSSTTGCIAPYVSGTNTYYLDIGFRG